MPSKMKELQTFILRTFASRVAAPRTELFSELLVVIDINIFLHILKL